MALFKSTGTVYTRSGSSSYNTQGDGRTAADFHYSQNQANNTTTISFQPVAYFYSAAGGGSSNTFSITATAKVVMNGKTVTKSRTISKSIGGGTATVWSGMVTIGDFPMTDAGTGKATITLTSSAVKCDGSTLGGASSRSTTFTYTFPTITRNYTVSYNANGGTGAPNNQTKTYGQTLTLSSTIPTKASTTATGYTVTFNPNGGTCSTPSATSTRTTNYSFSTWNTSANGTGTSYQAGGSYTANAAVTLYAQWSSSTVNGSVSLPTASMGGYIFLGWSTSTSGSVLSGSTYTPTSNVTLYAQWQLVPKIARIHARSGTSFVSDPLVKVKVNGNWHIVTNIKTRNSSGNF